MRTGLDLARARGLEIGPLANPLVRKSEGAITYIDYADAAALRDTYKNDPGVDISQIVEVDAIWGERQLAECVNGSIFDYVLASHVAEHVPDLITWLQEVRGVLKAEGQLRLALPDQRFSFDALRDETRLVDVLTNWVLRARRPQVHNVLDFRLNYAPKMDGLGRYEGRFDLTTLKPEHGFDVAVQSGGWARDMPEHYFDVHCWVFRPRSFARLMAELADHGLVQLACAELIDTAPPLFEFYVFLTPCDDPVRVAESWRAIESTVRDPLPGSAEDRAITEQRKRRRPNAPGQAELERRLAAAEAEIASLKKSVSWRITAPMRWAGRRL
jgi:SAM-dependent methyltransferase